MIIGLLLFILRQLSRNKNLSVQVERLSQKNDELRGLLSATIDKVESDREQVGTEIHDGLGGTLSTIKMNLQNASDSESNQQAIEKLNAAIDDVRILSRKMTPIVLTKYGLKAAIQELSHENERFNLQNEKWEGMVFSEKQELLLYRIIQQVLIADLYTDLIVENKERHVELTFAVQKSTPLKTELANKLVLQSLALCINSEVKFSQTNDGTEIIQLLVPLD